MENEILESFNCPICLEICDDPVESSCCKNLYCFKCSEKLDECSFCRSECDFERSILAKRLIDKIPTLCEYCKQKFTRGNLKTHLLNCDQFPFECPIDKCEADKMPKITLIEHIFTVHKDEINKKFNSLLNFFKNDETRVYNETHVYNRVTSLPLMNRAATASSFSSIATNNTEDERITIDKSKNSKGCVARLGESGKYYCKNRLDGASCTCCNGYCGPTNGCNCSSCMQLDLSARNLPRGWLVNSDGFAARKGASGLFYCGRFILQGVPLCDGYCGPTDGPNCASCKRLDNMTKFGGRYRQLI